jgi:hypothetical protein
MKPEQKVNTRVPNRIDVHHPVLPNLYLETLKGLGNLTDFNDSSQSNITTIFEKIDL